ncbi:hypothetical protein QBC34DRAFT_289335 [Podospora aff. communis PSN243]|uniref:Cytochrome P450 n=1 Tax=Podospora aff. communis PSN243 TaxID=3040156 RepID=A0AAV9H2S3_9PEZI|nr:hypothetical protein QBC34DRAFT_289335 [Podospora aff. communis PSN243]
MLTSTALIGTFAVCFVYLVHQWRIPRTRPTNSTHDQLDIKKEVNTVRQTIDFTYANSPSLEQRLALRAQPNQRLVSAFGVTNSLTTSSPEVHRKFLTLASTIINARRPNAQGLDTRWLDLYSTATTLLRQDLTTATTLPLASTIQRLCLTVVLQDNFSLPLPSLPASTILTIAHEINTQWVLSKCNPSTPLSSTLDSALRSLPLPMSPSEALSLIMPQYETLWRVVLLTFITAYHTQFSSSIASMTASVPGCLGTKSEEENKALRIAEEGLRLYPSNKTIYRAAVDFGGVVAADVQGLHRREEIWGMDALRFRPERFGALTEVQRRAYVPYSIGRHRCPAYGGFGNRMIAMLVVALGREMGRDRGKVRFERGDGGLEGEEKGVGVLPTGREDMEGWVFERVPEGEA